jgi:hypothetical protein
MEAVRMPRLPDRERGEVIVDCPWCGGPVAVSPRLMWADPPAVVTSVCPGCAVVLRLASGDVLRDAEQVRAAA